MLTLSVPAIDHSVLPHKVETRPKATMEWLSRLPFASPINTAQQRVMALYRPAVARAASGLEVPLSKSGIPPYPQQRQAGSLLGELHAEHSIGNKYLLRSLSSHRT